MVLSATAFFLPFAFVYNPALLEFPRLSWALVMPSVITVLATFALAVALFGHFHTRLGLLRRGLFALAVAAGVAYITRVEFLWLAIFSALLATAVVAAYARPASRDDGRLPS